MSDEIVTPSPLTLRVGGNRSLKVSDGFVTFEFFGTEMNVRASAIAAYRLMLYLRPDGTEVPAIEIATADKEYVIVNPCVADWNEFKDAIKSYRTTVKGAFA